MPKDDHDQLYRNFHQAVNMTAEEIEDWLETGQSRSVGIVKPGASESVGRLSARRIVRILRTPEPALDGADYVHMRKVVGYVRRHCAQGPHEEYRIPTSRWRYALMNWGHDPLRSCATVRRDALQCRKFRETKRERSFSCAS